ncbi:MAG: DUF5683 domain-containing protein [Candidatus Eisenbacteria bacterium]
MIASRALAFTLVALVALVACGAGGAAAQSTDPGDLSPVARPDSAGVTPAPGDSLRPPLAPERDARGERLRPWQQKPWAIMARSAVVPGLGQWTNGRRIKAVLVAGGEVAAGIQLAGALRDTDDAIDRERAALAAGDEATAGLARADYDRAFDRRATWAWVTATAVALAMLDAYVDAHLLQFDADFGPDPKLFDEEDASEVRVGLRFQFQGPTGR